MIKFFHVYKRSVVTIFVALLACFVMTTFGVDMGNRSSSEYAIKVDDTEISHQDFYREKRNVESNYRRMLGDMYDKFENTLLSRLNEQLVDRMIADTLIQRFASSQELYAGEQSVQSTIAAQIFGGRFDPSSYRALLAEMGLSARQFEERVAQDALKGQFAGLIESVSSASQREVRALYEEEETRYDIVYAEFKPADYAARVADPGDEELQKLYENRQEDLLLPPAVQYDYSLLQPGHFSNLVEITPEDVEAYYTDNRSHYVLPEELHLRQLQINIPAGSTESAKAEIKEKVLRLQQQAVAGDAFPALAQQNSEDARTAALGGDLGWIKKGVLPKELEAAAFKLLEGEVSDVIESGSAFFILKAEERKPEMLRPLDDVRAGIIEEIRKREAPAYLAAKARDLHDMWLKAGTSLADFAAANSLTLKSTAAALKKEQSPSPELKDLTARILDFPQDSKQLIELADSFVLADIRHYEEARVPTFSEARPRVFELYKEQEGRKLASEAADNLLQNARSRQPSDLKGAAEAAKLPLRDLKDIKRGTAQSGILGNEEARAAVFSAGAAGMLAPRVFEVEGRYITLQVSAVKKPDLQNLDSRRQQLEEQASRLLAQNTLDSLVNFLKAGSQVDVDQSILVER